MADSSRADFWEQRYREGVTPWEGGQLPLRARAFFAAQRPFRVLMPGCGSAADLPPLLAMGHDVLAVDFSEAAIELAARQWPEAAGRLLLADFFQLQMPAFDCLFERAFLCALPVGMRSQYAERVAALIAPGGALAGVFFVADTERGPPFGMQTEALRELLSPWFELEEDLALDESVAVFRNRERWMVWRRRGFDLGQVSEHESTGNCGSHRKE
ncbi:TPMT family class I SAM-dependent methyltransferase [Chromobacterium violaceum]|uniref:methyltransferase domain-containing protein n=1 Tax=Chromobacterium violaceum TaxID=536 RepID=UPI001E371451|nr:methyltransferase domain-containing protein [Chromobacterium violaceum]MCD0493687.1 TPMT family class I SAM-dependent methyltransferase [Chromobacterium violaceum]